MLDYFYELGNGLRGYTTDEGEKWLFWDGVTRLFFSFFFFGMYLPRGFVHVIFGHRRQQLVDGKRSWGGVLCCVVLWAWHSGANTHSGQDSFIAQDSSR